MMIFCKILLITVLCIAAVLPQGAHGQSQDTAVDLASVSDHQQFGCGNRCFARRRRAIRPCARLRRRGGRCNVVTCSRGTARRPDRRAGFRCVFISGPTAPTTVVTNPGVTVIQIAPTPAPTPSATMTATVTPSVTPTPSSTPSPSVTPSITATTTVSPTPSPSCTFALTGQIGQVPVVGTCRCGTAMASVTVLNPVSNNGMAIPNGGVLAMASQIESLTCYNNCLNDNLADLACDPESFPVFVRDGTRVVESCCTNCANTIIIDGNGVNRPTNQCFLAPP